VAGTAREPEPSVSAMLRSPSAILNPIASQPFVIASRGFTVSHDSIPPRSDGDLRSLARRDFLRASGAAALGAGSIGRLAFAGPFVPESPADEALDASNPYLDIVPADKKLDPNWVASLYARGEKEIVRDPAALSHIGMPIGGLFSGTVYLGGDGRLWLWDVFNRDGEGIAPRLVEFRGQPIRMRDGANYVSPAVPFGPFEQRFGVEVEGEARYLDSSGFQRIAFEGRYPIGRISYSDDSCPLAIELEAFSPFIPLDLESSSIPATIVRVTLENRTDRTIAGAVFACLENPICRDSGVRSRAVARNARVRDTAFVALVASVEALTESDGEYRPDLLFEDFEKPTYEGWTVGGDAFGSGPIRREDVPEYQGDLEGTGSRVVNSHASAPGDSIADKDDRHGTLTSRAFRIERRFIRFWVGGGAHAGETCVRLLVDGVIVDSISGENRNRMGIAAFDVAGHEGKDARIEIVDARSGGWGNIGVDEIVFTDRPPATGRLEEARDFGTFALGLLNRRDVDVVRPARGASVEANAAEAPLGAPLIGDVRRPLSLEAGERAEAVFVLAWHFPNFYGVGVGGARVGHSYATRFASALDVIRAVSRDFDRLAGTTRHWVDTWYDSTLPHWLLDRAMANTSILATTTCHRFADGRFWAWEGIGCCEGTCTHVWHYAQAPGRLFPELERDQRERVDFGLALGRDGAIGHRASIRAVHGPAVDGQCGRILGVYREHTMSADDSFLRRVWPGVQRATEWLISLDRDLDGVIEGEQANTLDAAWFGRIPWISSLYLAALRAVERMALELGAVDFSDRCKGIADRGAKSMLETFNGEYFVQIEDPAHRDDIATGAGCHIDQIFGQSWASQVRLGRLFDRDKQHSALRALWKYNFVPDIGRFREEFKAGRWYALAGDAGLVMCTWPRGGKNPKWADHWQAMYFNECMSGFEWQVASQMIDEGIDAPDLLESGLAVSRAIHDRYAAEHRNPYNEIECSDHYARALASYGVFVAVSGFEHHGPRSHIGFAPRIGAESFRSAFVAAEGWGSYSQTIERDAITATLELRLGRLRVRTLALRLPQRLAEAAVVRVEVSGNEAGAEPRLVERDGARIVLDLGGERVVEAGSTLRVAVRLSGRI
jgi:non-lysosomal glucosylceramidase